LFFRPSSLPFTVVIAGLDPAIHADAKLGRTYRISFRELHVSMATGSSPVVTRECVAV
jgi:hypothetical protein